MVCDVPARVVTSKTLTLETQIAIKERTEGDFRKLLEKCRMESQSKIIHSGRRILSAQHGKVDGD